ncbi:Uncharacterised protein [Mycoplasmopsis citelli]|uniref:Uncharacterized protein n=1 Tax=Mycoplasmopsis citelli TaxID=171281 RepID=A0A449B2J1_9BACT|nr:hypothetical protein [Mycoplasmopsis citelli]VEU74829.1 Uncharacterised protein [Mycoplasmopsis citelli]
MNNFNKEEFIEFLALDNDAKNELELLLSDEFENSNYFKIFLRKNNIFKLKDFQKTVIEDIKKESINSTYLKILKILENQLYYLSVNPYVQFFEKYEPQLEKLVWVNNTPHNQKKFLQTKALKSFVEDTIQDNQTHLKDKFKTSLFKLGEDGQITLTKAYFLDNIDIKILLTKLKHQHKLLFNKNQYDDAKKYISLLESIINNYEETDYAYKTIKILDLNPTLEVANQINELLSTRLYNLSEFEIAEEFMKNNNNYIGDECYWKTKIKNEFLNISNEKLKGISNFVNLAHVVLEHTKDSEFYEYNNSDINTPLKAVPEEEIYERILNYWYKKLNSNN